MDDDFDMTVRRFLKRVGITSQKAIEEAVRDAGADGAAGKAFSVRMVLTIDELGVSHTVEGRIGGKAG